MISVQSVIVGIGAAALGLVPWGLSLSARTGTVAGPAGARSWTPTIVGLALIIGAMIFYAQSPDGLGADAFGSLTAAFFVVLGTKIAADNLALLAAAHVAEYSSNLHLGVSIRTERGERKIRTTVTNGGRVAAFNVRVVRWVRGIDGYWYPERLSGISEVILPNANTVSEVDHDGALKEAFLMLGKPVYEVYQESPEGLPTRRIYEVGRPDSLGYIRVALSTEDPSFEDKRRAIERELITEGAKRGFALSAQQIGIELSGATLSLSLDDVGGKGIFIPEFPSSSPVESIVEQVFERLRW